MFSKEIFCTIYKQLTQFYVRIPFDPKLYMIIVMVTPIYNDVTKMSQTGKLLYSINPFTHMCSLYYWALGLDTIVSPLVSLIYIITLCIILCFYVDKIWKNRGTIEKLNIW